MVFVHVKAHLATDYEPCLRATYFSLQYADTPTGSFMTRHTSDMRISYVHDRLNYILRNELKTLMGASFFELIEPIDLPAFREVSTRSIFYLSRRSEWKITKAMITSRERFILVDLARKTL